MTKRSVFGVLLFVAAAMPPSLDAQQAGFLVDTSLSITQTGGVIPQSVFSNQATSGFSFLTDVDSSGSSNYRLQPSLRWIQDSFRVEVSYRQADFYGRSALSGGGARRPLSIPTTLYTSLSQDVFSAGFRYDVFRKPLFDVGFGADLDVISVRSDVYDPSGQLQANGNRSNSTRPVAVGSFNLHDEARRLFLDVKLGYSGFDGEEIQKGRAEVGFTFAKHSGLRVGWEGQRYLQRTSHEAADGEPSSTSQRRLDLRTSSFSGGFFFRF